MKTLPTSMTTLRNLLAGFFVSGAFFMTGTAAAQDVKFVDNAPIHTQITEDLKIALYPVENEQMINVHVENPEHKKVRILITNSQNELVYQKTVGNGSIIYSKFNLSQLEKGVYTMVIESATQRYANSFAIENRQHMAKAF